MALSSRYRDYDCRRVHRVDSTAQIVRASQWSQTKLMIRKKHRCARLKEGMFHGYDSAIMVLQVSLRPPCTGCTSIVPEMERRRHALWNYFSSLFLGGSLSYLRQDSYELLWALPIFGAYSSWSKHAWPKLLCIRDVQISRLENGWRNTRFDIACMHDGVVKAGLLCQVIVCSRGQVACCLDWARYDGFLSSRRKPSCAKVSRDAARIQGVLAYGLRKMVPGLNGVVSDCL